MSAILPLSQIKEADRPKVGGKAFALALAAGHGFSVPETVCLTTDAYHAFVDNGGLRERIQLELHRKRFEQMRWEEIWDCALRIRNRFLANPLPGSLQQQLAAEIEERFSGRALVVRSSAPEEDTAAASFAGLHESVVNVSGLDAVADAVRRVWASLWSDAALLYRQELGLDVETSAMAVVVQEIVVGERSGVVFTRDVNDPDRGLVEAVYGLNAGLVDGAVEPDRWTVDRTTGSIVSHEAPDREHKTVPGRDGTVLAELSERERSNPPLTEGDVGAVFSLAAETETLFGRPQDVEWTFSDGRLVLLQSRPITTGGEGDEKDRRAWYLSLHRSFDNLVLLRERIENTHIPAMIEAARALAAVELPSLSSEALAEEIFKRLEINTRWANVYYEEFIPFAHGIRLFGQTYNDVVRPEDPYEFMHLLGQTPMLSLERNRLLEKMAESVRKSPDLEGLLRKGRLAEAEAGFREDLATFIERFGDLSCPVTGAVQCGQGPEAVLRLVLALSARPERPAPERKRPDTGTLKEAFFRRFEGEERNRAAAMLDLARASYRLRDDDNMHIGRIEARLLDAANEARLRLENGRADKPLKEALALVDRRPTVSSASAPDARPASPVRARQLTGQPAGPGLWQGPARVVVEDADLSRFRHGEVLVCDAVDPNMTFVVPLASAIVERRGGMLIHGAIIAREYGIPCVTGVADATTLIRTGDRITVDGYLGIVTVGDDPSNG
ncbi:MAG: PEP/pyruvate-binding domain-containing protein [Desulfobacterales bacterium]|jgi:pyruvate,water dikinase